MTAGEDHHERTERKCPNCGGHDNQTVEWDERICWKCGKRWST